MAPIKVFFYVFFPGGGIARYTHELASAMLGHPEVDVEVLCSPDYEWISEANYRTWPELASIVRGDAVSRRVRFLRGQLLNPRRAIAYAAERGADVLHLSNINHLTYPYWRRAVTESGMRLVATAHDIRRQKSIISRRWEDPQLRSFYRRADALFVHSAYQADELAAFAGIPPSCTHIVPHGPYAYDPPRRSAAEVRRALNIPERASLGLFFGQIRDEKNLGTLIQALGRSSRNIHLLVAGRSGGRHKSVGFYKALATSEGVSDRVTFLEQYIPDREVGDLFTASDWVALPYDASFTSQSGVLNVAAHYDRPVLVTPAPVLSETVLSSGIGEVCKDFDADAVAEGIDLLVSRLTSRHLYDFAGYRRAYSWARNVEETISVYRRLVNRVPEAAHVGAT